MVGLVRHVRKLKYTFLRLKTAASVFAILGIIFALVSVEICQFGQTGTCEASFLEQIIIKSIGTVFAVGLSVLVYQTNLCWYRIVKHSETFNALNDNRAIDDLRLEAYRYNFCLSTALEVAFSMIHPIPGFSKYFAVETMGRVEMHSLDELLTIVMLLRLYHLIDLAVAVVQKKKIDDIAFFTGDGNALKLSMKNSYVYTFRLAMRHYAIELLTVALIVVTFVSAYALRIAEGRRSNSTSQYYWTQLWMSLSTLSTTGYGRAICCSLMLIGILATSHLITAIIRSFQPSALEEQVIDQALNLKAKARVIVICARIFQNKWRFSKGKVSKLFYNFLRKQLRVQLTSALLEMKVYKLDSRGSRENESGNNVVDARSTTYQQSAPHPARHAVPLADQHRSPHDNNDDVKKAFSASHRLTETLKRLEASLNSLPTVVSSSGMHTKADRVVRPKSGRRVATQKESPGPVQCSDDSVSAELGFVFEGRSFIPSHSLHL
eukprot:762994-Hanusia_phi.AAC.1